MEDRSSLPTLISEICPGESVVLGSVSITEVISKYPRWNLSLKNLMNFFFRVKEQLDAIVLTPRAISICDLFHLPPVSIGTDFADQVWFASAVSGKKKRMVKTLSTIEEELYPSNASMVREVADYLENGKSIKSLDIFHNLESLLVRSPGRYSIKDLDKLVEVLGRRQLSEIEEYTTMLVLK